MNALLIATAMVSLLLLMLNLRKSTLTPLIKIVLSMGLLALAVICFVSVYGVISGIVCTLATAMVIGLLTAFVAGKAPQLLD